ncbi:hypothetical protein J132_03707 [Termitomyces sp. J132]|nr:hypothetical protein J132_03707 [Termitomyces sp. J132]
MVDSIQNQLKISSLPIQPASSSSSFPPVLASTLAPIAEAEEPNKDKAAEPKEDVSKMDKSTTVALSTISDNSAPISNPISSTTNSGIPSRSTPINDSVLISNPGSSATGSVIATGPTAGDKSTAHWCCHQQACHSQ